MTKVFVSSTSRDLGAYRQKALEICHRFDLQPVAMEYFEAMSTGATKGSLRKVDESDLYIGIFAYRYGYIEDGYPKAVTELEFDRAIEQGIDRLCFIVDPAYPWPPEAIDYENHEKLEQFKRRVDKFHIRALFTTVDDFAVKLTQAIVNWKQTKGMSIAKPTGQTQPQRIVLAPPRPGLVVGRERDLEEIKKRLRNTQSRNRATIVRGWPGVGKTTVILSLAYDETLEQDFPDGVLWASVGQTPNIFAELKNWAAEFGKDDIGITIQDATRNVKRLLANKRMLLIVDDVWEVEDALPFREAAGPNCALLITTREDGIAGRLAETRDDIYYLNQLTDDQALELLQRLAPKVVENYPQESRALVVDLEGLPLAIRVVGRLLDNEARLKNDVRDLMEDMRRGKMLDESAPLDPASPEAMRAPTMTARLSQSTDRLEPEIRVRFATLGTFAPKPATFDLGAMQFIWEVPDALPTVRILTDRGLLEPLPTIGRYQMHALLVMLANKLLRDEKALNAPVKRNRSTKAAPAPLNPLMNADTPDVYKAPVIKQLIRDLRTLRRKKLKGEPVDDDIESVIAEILRLGGDLNEV